MSTHRAPWSISEVLLVLFSLPFVDGVTGSYLLWRGADRSTVDWPGLETALTLLAGGAVVMAIGLLARRDRLGTAGLAVGVVVLTGLVVAGCSMVADIHMLWTTD